MFVKLLVLKKDELKIFIHFFMKLRGKTKRKFTY